MTSLRIPCTLILTHFLHMRHYIKIGKWFHFKKRKHCNNDLLSQIDFEKLKKWKRQTV